MALINSLGARPEIKESGKAGTAKMIFQLLYFSTANHKMDEPELTEILKKANLTNIQKGISGFLLYMDGTFAQVLEGQEKIVNELYLNKITKDNRHHDCMVLVERTVPAREFPEWSMGFHNLSGKKLDHLPGFTSLANWVKAQEVSPPQPGQLRKMMLGLIKANRED